MIRIPLWSPLGKQCSWPCMPTMRESYRNMSMDFTHYLCFCQVYEDIHIYPTWPIDLIHSSTTCSSFVSALKPGSLTPNTPLSFFTDGLQSIGRRTLPRQDPAGQDHLSIPPSESSHKKKPWQPQHEHKHELHVRPFQFQGAEPVPHGCFGL